MMSQPKYIVILTCLCFCSVVAGVLRTFTRFFPVNVLAGVDFLVWQLWPMALASQAQANKMFKPIMTKDLFFTGVNVLANSTIIIAFIVIK